VGDCAHPEQLHRDGGELKEVRLPKKPIEVLQVVEYLRAFLVGREAWAGFNMLPIISGAFGIFQRDLVKQVGGFRTQAVGEDLDLVIRLHRHLQEEGRPYHINFIPDPTCWTERPQIWLHWLASARVGTKA